MIFQYNVGTGSNLDRSINILHMSIFWQQGLENCCLQVVISLQQNISLLLSVVAFVKNQS